MSKYNVQSTDIINKFEFYADSEGVSVTSSNFTNGVAGLLAGKLALRTALGGIIPNSASSGYLGNYNNTSEYQVNAQPIDVALHGCRPMGKFVYTINASVGSNVTYYLNRVNGQTWLSTTAGSASGTRLDHDPLFVHLELQGGGASGCSRLNGFQYRRGGGSGGAYVYCPLAIPENSYATLVVGLGGVAKSAGDDSGVGNHGGATYVQVNGATLASAGGGYRAGDTSHIYDGDTSEYQKGIEGGDASINGAATTRTVKTVTNTTLQGYTAYGYKGGYSGGAETRYNTNEYLNQINIPFSVPEGRIESHGPIDNWDTLNNSAGSGGSSYFAQGAKRSTEAGRPGSMGSGGGSGANMTGSDRKGGDGGPGLIKIWY